MTLPKNRQSRKRTRCLNALVRLPEGSTEAKKLGNKINNLSKDPVHTKKDKSKDAKSN